MSINIITFIYFIPNYNECSSFVHVKKVRINYGIRTALKRKIPSRDSHVASP